MHWRENCSPDRDTGEETHLPPTPERTARGKEAEVCARDLPRTPERRGTGLRPRHSVRSLLNASRAPAGPRPPALTPSGPAGVHGVQPFPPPRRRAGSKTPFPPRTGRAASASGRGKTRQGEASGGDRGPGGLGAGPPPPYPVLQLGRELALELTPRPAAVVALDEHLARHGRLLRPHRAAAAAAAAATTRPPPPPPAPLTVRSAPPATAAHLRLSQKRRRRLRAEERAEVPSGARAAASPTLGERQCAGAAPRGGARACARTSCVPLAAWRIPPLSPLIVGVVTPRAHRVVQPGPP